MPEIVTRARRHAGAHPGRPLLHQGGDGRDRRGLRRRALRALLLPRLLARRLRHARRPARARRARRPGRPAVRAARATTTATSPPARSTPRSPTRRAASPAVEAAYAGRDGVDARRPRRAHRHRRGLVVQPARLQHRAAAAAQRRGAGRARRWPRCGTRYWGWSAGRRTRRGRGGAAFAARGGIRCARPPLGLRSRPRAARNGRPRGWGAVGWAPCAGPPTARTGGRGSAAWLADRPGQEQARTSSAAEHGVVVAGVEQLEAALLVGQVGDEVGQGYARPAHGQFGRHPQGQGQPGALLRQHLGGGGIVVDPGADQRAQKGDGVGRGEHVQGQPHGAVAGYETTQRVTARDHRDAGGGAGQERAHLLHGRGVVEQHEHPPLVPAPCGRRRPARRCRAGSRGSARPRPGGTRPGRRWPRPACPDRTHAGRCRAGRRGTGAGPVAPTVRPARSCPRPRFLGSRDQRGAALTGPPPPAA